MPVEIRELVIRTTLVSPQPNSNDDMTSNDLLVLKQQIIQECLKTLKEKNPKNSFNR